MSDLYKAKMRLQETALALTAHELTDYYAVQSGPAYQDYLEDQMANAARDYVAAFFLGNDNLPDDWDDSDDKIEDLKRRIQGLEN